MPWEIRLALVNIFDLLAVVPDLELFGEGVVHDFDAPTMRYTDDGDVSAVEAVGAELSHLLGSHLT